MVPLHYGQVVSGSIDPIEKKPLYHFHPGRPILSIAAPGCNLHCLFCQNWNISQQEGQITVSASPHDIVIRAEREKSLGIAYTYSEPLVWYEFVLDTAQLAKQRGLKNVLVTNGFLNPEPLAQLLPLIDAANIDLKALDERFYRKICKGRLEPILAAIRQFHAAGVHVEITNLVIPGHNDQPEQLQALVDFVADLDRHIPLHFSAYHPAWRLEAPATPLNTLQKARELACQKLDWVYLGNVPLSEGQDSMCPHCGQVVVCRSGYQTENRLQPGAVCPGCSRSLPFIMDNPS